MSEFKGTPGPWQVRIFPTREFAKQQTWVLDSIPDQDGKVVANAVAVVAKSNECHEANARLIAAAPELLAACEAVLAHVEDMDAPRVLNQCTLCATYRKILYDAIAKAKGTP